MKNFPNPFRYATRINYEIPLVDEENVGVKTTIRIYSINGRLIKTLVNGKVNAGYYTVSWDGSANGKETIPVGMYICRMESGKFADSRRLLLLK